MWSKSYLDLLGVTVDNLIPRENSLNHTTASSSKVMQLTPPSPGSSSAGLLSSLAANASLPAQHPYLMTPGSHHPLNSLPPLLQHQPNSSLNWELIQRFLVASSAAAGHPLLPVQQQQQLQLQQQQLFFSQAGMTGQHFLSPSQQQARLKFSIENILSPTFGAGDEQPSLKSKSVPDSSSSSSKRLLVPSSSLSSKRKNSSDSEKSTNSSSSNSRYLNHPHLPASSSSHHLPSNNNHNKNSHKKSPKKEEASSPGIVSSTSGSPSSSSSSSFSLSCNKFNSKNNNNHVTNKKEDDMKQVDCTGKQQLDSDGSLVKPVTSSKDSGLSSGSSSSSNTSSEYNFKPDSKGDANARPSLPSFPTLDGKEPMVWPAWVYCTRYSDRPSSGKSLWFIFIILRSSLSLSFTRHKIRGNSYSFHLFFYLCCFICIFSWHAKHLCFFFSWQNLLFLM